MPQQEKFPLGLSFDDVLIVPNYSKVVTRKLIDLKTRFSKNIWLNIPIVSANMDTVTEAAMAIAMARAGGIGVIHRFMTAEQQLDEVRRVKRAETLVVVDPLTIRKEADLKEMRELMESNNVSSVLVTDEQGALEGIVTARDIRFRNGHEGKVADVMTPKERLVTARPDIQKEEVIKIFEKNKIEKLPLVNEQGILVGLITAADFTKTNRYRHAAKDSRGRLLVAAAIGVKDGEERAEKLAVAGADALVIDIAHGHHQTVIDLIKKLKDKYRSRQIDIIAGNVATAEGTKDLIDAGADAVKVGIGPGKACSTRVVAGAGVPQITAILECGKIAREHNIPIIADGGIKNPGDIAKAAGAGASSIMVGSLLAGTKESPGDYFIEDGVAFKSYRGLASREASLDRDFVEKNKERLYRAAEGISTKVSYRGEVAGIVQMLVDGLQSGMSYSGAENIREFWEKIRFIRVTEAGYREGMPRP